jgi:hypothetical protein
MSSEEQLEQLLESPSRPSSPEPLLEPSYSSPPSPNFKKINQATLPKTTQRAIRFLSISAIIISAILLFREFFAQSSACSNFKIPNTSSIFRPQNDNNIVSHTLNIVEYSIKPVVYIFPQYYPFPENNKIWGENFTEWNNVLKVTHNAHGLETIRPHGSIGYYNGLSLSTRRRQAKLINENGFYGLAYHHYWMSGKPIMDHVLQAMLKDGEPNTPFMLSWANEPWIGTWEGQSHETTFIAQDYGNIVNWRKHFDYLLPFFRHKKYIRSAGKVQFIMYKADDMDMRARGTKTSMYAAFRIWAVEEGLGGMVTPFSTKSKHRLKFPISGHHRIQKL